MSTEHSRRRFLISSAVATAGAGLAACTGGAGLPANDTACTAGGATVTVADVPVGSYVRPTGEPYVIARDADGFFAFSTVCTHQGCGVSCPDTTGTITCSCHGAQYNANGDVTRGPATRDLDHYVVTFTGTGSTATITVDTTQVQTDRTLRVPPPAGATG